MSHVEELHAPNGKWLRRYEPGLHDRLNVLVFRLTSPSKCKEHDFQHYSHRLGTTRACVHCALLAPGELDPFA